MKARGSGCLFSDAPEEFARVRDLLGTSSTVGMRGERGVGGSITSSGGGGGEVGVWTGCREMHGPAVRSANGSSSRRKSGGGESREDGTKVGVSTGESGEGTGSSLGAGRILQRPLTAAAEECARSLEVLFAPFALKSGLVPSGLVGVELEPWRNVGTRIDCTERLRFPDIPSAYSSVSEIERVFVSSK